MSLKLLLSQCHIELIIIEWCIAVVVMSIFCFGAELIMGPPKLPLADI
jgi:hypothetical protein